MKVPKWQIAANFLERNGRITALDVVKECNTVSPHKFLEILRAKVGLRALENTGTPYKIFVKADKQIKLNL